MPKVSIIIPVYNTAKYLDKCLTSAINQTLKDIEIICVNDGSTDNSDEIIKSYMQKDSRIKYIKFAFNRGVSKARNTAISIAKGEFIGFIDSDDYVDNKYFENLYNQKADYDVIRGMRVVGDKKCKNKYGCLVPSIIRLQFLLDNPRLRFPNKQKGEDSTLKRWIYSKTNKIFEVEDNKIYYHYEKRPGSLSNYTNLKT